MVTAIADDDGSLSAAKNGSRNDLIGIIDSEDENDIIQLERQEIVVGNDETAADENESDAPMAESNGDGTNDNDQSHASHKFEIIDKCLPLLPLVSLDIHSSDEFDAISTPQKCQSRKMRPPTIEIKNKVKRNTDKQLKCHQCEYATFYVSNLKRHQRVHVLEESMGVALDANKLYDCTQCIRKFTKLSHLCSHKKSHEDDNQYLYYCTRCMRQFVQTADKDRHERQCGGHHFECHLCKMYVAQRKYLMQDHMRTHSGAKPFRCVVCNKVFNLKGNLKHHLNTVHSRLRT